MQVPPLPFSRSCSYSYPMIILSITCGRDASATILKDGRILVHVLRERVTRKRHAMGLCQKTIAYALKAAKISPQTIDACAITGNHGEPLLIEKGPLFAIDCEGSNVFQPHQARTDEAGEWLSIIWKSPRLAPPSWEEENYLISLKEHVAKHIPDMTARRMIMDVPVKALIEGRAVPAVFVDHHAAHAAASYYASPFKESVVVTHDSGEGMDSGLLFYGRDNHLYPIAPHNLEIAELYDQAALRCGLEGHGRAGKFMGLSAYDKPLKGVASLAGTIHDWRKRLGATKSNPEVLADMVAFICDAVAAQGTTLFGLGDAAKLPFAGASIIAASVQALFSETMFQTCVKTAQALKDANHDADNLCLGGGAALNCPTNTRLALHAGFKDIFIAPHTENGGLSIGAAWWYIYNTLGQPRTPNSAAISAYAMMGAAQSEKAAQEALAKHKNLHFEKPENVIERTADDLAKGLIVAWFEGESETGPRALGHRSLLADPRESAMATRMNKLKNREAWRPFAPVCTAEALNAWFENGPAASPFMLYTYTVREDKKDQLRAVTHVDGTARTQTVSQQDGKVYELLKAFEKRTSVPVLLNTSFNGPGEPIIETPDNAIAFLLANDLDVLYLEGYRVTRK